jgi:hypothetical protein
MKLKLYHPWWTHLPALALLGVICGAIVAAALLPGHSVRESAMHGKLVVTIILGVTLAPAVFILIISFIMDEEHARVERHKTFNWLSLLDEIVLALLASLAWYIFSILSVPGAAASFFLWPIFVTLLVGAVASAVVLERLRPHAARAREEIDAAFAQKISAGIAAGARWVYRESTPLRGNSFIPVIVMGLLIIAVMRWWSSPFLACFFALVAVGLLKYLWGLQTTVTVESISLRQGIFSTPLFCLRAVDIVNMEIIALSTLRDPLIGGVYPPKDTVTGKYGYTHVIKLLAYGGEQYLLASTHPQRLFMVLQSVMAYHQLQHGSADDGEMPG